MTVEVRDILTTGRGLELEFQPSDQQIRYRVEQEGQWEEPVAKAIEKFLKPEWTMLDIGAHVGYFTTIAASRGNTVIAVEPLAHDILARNVARNGLNDRVEIHSVALTDTDETSGFMDVDAAIYADAPGTSHLTESGTPVVLARLRDVLGDRRPEFIKIDIEGMEHRVFSDMPEVLDAAEVVVFEASPDCRRYGSEIADTLNLLRERGMTVMYMNGVEVGPNWVKELEKVPHGYINLLALRHPVEAVRGTILLCAWRDMKIETAESLLQLRDLGWGYAIVRGDALIARSRARAVSNWYKNCPDEDAFLMIDDDVVFTAEHAASVLALAREKRSIAVGAYVVKDGGHLACRRFPGQEITFGPDVAPVEIEYPATGFMAVHRDVIDAMVAAKNPDGSDVFPYCDAFGLSPMWPFFDTFCKKWNEGEENERWEYLSEDYAFGEQARRLGFKVWLDPSVILFHLGTFPYNVYDMKGAKRSDQPNG